MEKGLFLSNAHTHTNYCDGLNTPREMAEAANRLGFVSLGFSGHGAQGFDPAYAMDGGRQERYLRELRGLQAEARNTPGAARLWVGVEQDATVPAALKAQNRMDFDYIIGCTHYVCVDYKGGPVAADGYAPLLLDYVKEMYHGDMLAMVRYYYEAHTRMLAEDRPDIIGHFDLVRKAAECYGFYDAGDPAYRKLALSALEKARAAGGVLEVNTGGVARGIMRNPYPSEELLRAWLEMGGQVTLTSDCHDAEKLDFGLDEAFSRLKALGCQSVLRLGTGSELWEEVSCG